MREGSEGCSGEGERGGRGVVVREEGSERCSGEGGE